MTITNDYKFEPVKKDSIVIELTNRILDFIFSGSIRPGDKLPAERVLSESLGVGRSSIREAMKALTVLGILEVRPGDGTYLRQADSGLLTQSIEWGLLLGERKTLDLIEARKEIEIVLARYAATRWQDNEIDELKQILNKMKGASIEEFIEIDVEFHLKVADMSRNSVLKDILISIQSLLRTWIKLVLESAGTTLFSYENHEEIYLAIFNRKPDEAVKAMTSHMDDATERLIEVINLADRVEEE